MRTFPRMLIAGLVVCVMAGCGQQKSEDTKSPKERPGRRREQRQREPKAAVQQGTPATATDAQQDLAKALFEQSCSKCHPTSKPETYKGAMPWKDIVARMISEKKAQISPEDSAKIVGYLEKTHPRP